jgi:hypothetical protein
MISALSVFTAAVRAVLVWARAVSKIRSASPAAIGPRLRQPFCRQGITGGPGRVVSRVGLAAHLAIQVPPRPAEA